MSKTIEKLIEDEYELMEKVYSALQKIGSPKLVLPVCMVISAYQAWLNGTSFEDYMNAIRDVSEIFWKKNLHLNLDN